MTARAAGRKLCVLVVIAAAAIAALTVAPAAGAADRAGDVYQTDIAKAKEKRAAALAKCKNKPTKAKKKACRKKAKAAYKQAKQKAAAKRDKARENEDGGGKDRGSPQEEREDYIECRKEGGRPSECRRP